MGLFKKKSDPISDRARVLSEEIAALEAQIQKLSAQPSHPRAPSQVNHHTQTAPPAPVPPASQPRLRSTALPQHRHALLPHAVSTPVVHEPVFEEVDHKGLQSSPRVIPPARTEELGVRKYDLTSSWNRLKNHFRGPPTSNPKLVNYLAAGSIQGLRPLRYERRVARNRFIALLVFLVAVLWGLIAMFFRHR